MKTRIIVNLTIEGTHWWPDCDIREVLYLRNEHRHQFAICAKKEVGHEDRDIEIICFKREIAEYLHRRFGEPCNFGTLSCETIARILAEEFSLEYCSVLEDGENGAEITE